MNRFETSSALITLSEYWATLRYYLTPESVTNSLARALPAVRSHREFDDGAVFAPDEVVVDNGETRYIRDTN